MIYQHPNAEEIRAGARRETMQPQPSALLPGDTGCRVPGCQNLDPAHQHPAGVYSASRFD